MLESNHLDIKTPGAKSRKDWAEYLLNHHAREALTIAEILALKAEYDWVDWPKIGERVYPITTDKSTETAGGKTGKATSSVKSELKKATKSEPYTKTSPGKEKAKKGVEKEEKEEKKEEKKAKKGDDKDEKEEKKSKKGDEKEEKEEKKVTKNGGKKADKSEETNAKGMIMICLLRDASELLTLCCCG